MAVALKPRWSKGWARVAAAHSGLEEHVEVRPCTSSCAHGPARPQPHGAQRCRPGMPMSARLRWSLMTRRCRRRATRPMWQRGRPCRSGDIASSGRRNTRVHGEANRNCSVLLPSPELPSSGCPLTMMTAGDWSAGMPRVCESNSFECHSAAFPNSGTDAVSASDGAICLT